MLIKSVNSDYSRTTNMTCASVMVLFKIYYVCFDGRDEHKPGYNALTSIRMEWLSASVIIQSRYDGSGPCGVTAVSSA